METHMAGIIFITALILQAALTAWRIYTRSRQSRVKSYIRIGALAAFILFTLAGVLQWSMRWYPLAALLLIWAALAAWALYRPNQPDKEYRLGRTLFSAFAALLLLAAALVPALIFPQHTPPILTGPFTVAVSSEIFTDNSRIETFTASGEHRQIGIECWYPADASDVFPLILFSHGAFGIRTSNLSTYMELASNGYVVCSLDHPFHSLYAANAAGRMVIADRAFIQEVMDANRDIFDDGIEFELTQKWMALRTADLHFILDTILARAGDPGSGDAYAAIDPNRIGLIGHSLGGAAVTQLARERAGVHAVVNLDSNPLGEYLDYAGGSFTINTQPFPVPLLVIYSDDMMRIMADLPPDSPAADVRLVLTSSPSAYEFHIAGTDHLSLTDLPLVSPFLANFLIQSVQIGGGEKADTLEVIEEMNATVLSFFNAYLKSIGTFQPPTTQIP
jgi:dienelactone hydrolase